MKHIKLLLVALTISAFSVSASAQFMNSSSSKSSGMASNENFSSVYVGFHNQKFGDEADLSMPGLVLGVDNAFSVSSSPIYVTYGANFTFNTKKDHDIKYTTTSIEIPVGVGYRFEIPNTQVSLFPNAGIDAKYFVSGKAKAGGDSIDLFSSDGADLNAFQFGAHIGVKALVDNFVVGFEYRPYFTELADDVKLSSISLIVGVAF